MFFQVERRSKNFNSYGKILISSLLIVPANGRLDAAVVGYMACSPRAVVSLTLRFTGQLLPVLSLDCRATDLPWQCHKASGIGVRRAGGERGGGGIHDRSTVCLFVVILQHARGIKHSPPTPTSASTSRDFFVLRGHCDGPA